MNRYTFETLEVCESLGFVPIVSPIETLSDGTQGFYAGYQDLSTLYVHEIGFYTTWGEAMAESCKIIDKLI